MTAGHVLAGRIRAAFLRARAHQFIVAEHLSQLAVASGQWQADPGMHAAIFLFDHPADGSAPLQRGSEAQAIGFAMLAQQILDLAATGLHAENLAQARSGDSEASCAESVELNN